MFTFLSIVYVLVCGFLILVVLLQAGRGGGMGTAFGGGGGSQTVFGGQGATTFLTRLTWICAVMFMLLSGTLAYLSSSSDKLLENQAKIAAERAKAREVSKTSAAAAVPNAGLSSVENTAGEKPAAAEAPAPAAEAAQQAAFPLPGPAAAAPIPEAVEAAAAATADVPALPGSPAAAAAAKAKRKGPRVR